MKTRNWLTTAALAAGLFLGLNTSYAQQDNGPGAPPPGGPGGGGPGGNFRNMTPEERQKRMAERIKEQLEITDDAEWTAIQPLVQKVMEARMQTMGGMGRGMFGGPPPRQGQDGAQAQPQRRNPFGGTPSPEAEALQKAIDAKAPKAELKAAIAKYAESRKVKQTQLEKAQDDLRKVLTTRQEALATVNGLL